METHLTYDNRSKQLGILVKERLTTNDNLQLKVAFVYCRLCASLTAGVRAESRHQSQLLELRLMSLHQFCAVCET